jgi:hypothetical protein
MRQANSCHAIAASKWLPRRLISYPLPAMANATRTVPRPAEQPAAKTPEATKPQATFRSGAVSVARFAEGTVSLRRSYKNRNGEWVQTHTLRLRDLPHALKALSECLVDCYPKPESEAKSSEE